MRIDRASAAGRRIGLLDVVLTTQVILSASAACVTAGRVAPGYPALITRPLAPGCGHSAAGPAPPTKLITRRITCRVATAPNVSNSSRRCFKSFEISSR